MLLVVTNKHDLTSDYLALKARARNLPFLRLNTEDLGHGFKLTIEIGPEGGEGRIHLPDRSDVLASQIRGAYLRRPGQPTAPADTAEEHRPFAEAELAETFRAFWPLIPTNRWLNAPNALRSASIKTRQLLMARECGLRIPATRITSHQPVLREVARTWEHPLVTKSVRTSFVTVDGQTRLAATSRLPDTFPFDLAEFADVPATYQPEVRKRDDLRVTVVDDHVFAAAIQSQADDRTRVDWRVPMPAGAIPQHEPIELEAEIADACRRVTKGLGLRFAAIDLIRSDDGSVIFLEANPNGEWMWIERLCGYPIRDAILKALGSEQP